MLHAGNIFAAADGEWHLAFHPALPVWLLAMGAPLVAALLIWLYLSHRQIASKRIVRVLTLVRVLALLCVAVMLLAPALAFVHRQFTSGTLWVVLDGSGSMDLVDAQAGPIEKIRWADALGYLPADVRSVKLDRTVAELTCIREDLRRAMPTEAAKSNAAASGESTALVKAVQSVAAQIDALADTLAHGSSMPAGVSAAVKDLRSASSQLTQKLELARTRGNYVAAAGDVPWQAVFGTLDGAAGAMKTIADRSDAEFVQSHATNDVVNAALAKVTKRKRSELAYEVLTRKGSLGAEDLPRAMGRYHTRIISIADSAKPLQPMDETELPEVIKRGLGPIGGATNLSSGLQMIGEQMLAEEATNVVLLSDGRSNAGGDPADAAEQLARRGVRTYSLAIGSPRIAVDAAVESTDAPDWIFKGDTIKAAAVVRLNGLTGRKLPVEFRRGDKVIDTQTITAANEQDVQRLTFQDTPTEPGRYNYEVRVGQTAGEIDTINNSQWFGVSVKKEKLTVLVIEELPRWEYRYVVNYLSRDDRVKLQTVLLQPAKAGNVTPPAPVKASPGNPQQEAQVLPQTKEEWSAFDLIILGDIPRETLSAQDQEFIVATVKDRGTALVVMAGAAHMPSHYLNTPIATMLPVEISSDWSRQTLQEHLRNGYRVTPTAEGAASILGQFTLDAEQNAKFWSMLPAWYWHSEQTQAKPSATVMWTMRDMPREGAAAGGNAELPSMEATRRQAALAVMSMGLGRVMYLATDQTWRMRHVGGENLQDRFWGQVVAWAAGNDLPAGGKYVRFGTDRPRYAGSEAPIVTVRVLGKDLSPLRNQKFKVVARLMPATAPATTMPATTAAVAVTKPASVPVAEAPRVVATADVTEVAESPGFYRAQLGGLPGGDIQISMEGAAIEQLMAEDPSMTERSIGIQVQPQLDLELRNTNTDRAMLERMVRAGGGVMLDGPYADILMAHLPRTDIEHTTVEQIGFFTDPKNGYTRQTHLVFLIVFVGLVTLEWVIRKVAGLV